MKRSFIMIDYLLIGHGSIDLTPDGPKPGPWLEETGSNETMNKRDAVLDILDAGKPQDYTPAGFFIHFDPSCHFGQAAVDKHLEFFRHTDMDLVKIQYERNFPYQPGIRKPEDWANLPLLTRDFFQPQLDAVDGLVRAAKDEAVVIVTLYSAFMCAGQASNGLITEHLKENPDQAKKGIEIATESLLTFVRACIDLGVDGFYASTQGGESARFEDKTLFLDYIKPYDLALMEEFNRACIFNVLHVCDYTYGYDDLTPFLEYPGQVVNCNPRVGSKALSGQEISELFGRPFMGGLERKGVIATGGEAEIAREVRRVLRDAPDKFFLAADCTLPHDVSWDNIKTAISTAHRFQNEM
ncbi:MAG: uroporphyrinogen decarboxylase family protein [Chloroflexota bacterium]|nr:uroporphyrinogen decarboxylase family protein [Chloroflexota bacterium]